MTFATNARMAQTAQLDSTLQYAAVQSWDELIPPSAPGLVHIEYQTGSDGSLDFLKVWASIVRGEWTLVCEVWMKPLWSHIPGMYFSNGFQPDMFAHAMKSLMEYDDPFSMLPGQSRLLQVYPPSKEQRREAAKWMGTAFSRERVAGGGQALPA